MSLASTVAHALHHETAPGPVFFSAARRALELLEGTRSEPCWLRAARRTRLLRAVDLGLPTTRAEEWRNTDVQPLLTDLADALEEPARAPEPFAVLEATGVQVRPVSEVVELEPSIAEAWLFGQDHAEVFSSLAEALFEHGLVVVVPEGVRGAKLEIEHSGGATPAAFSRLVVVLGAGSAAEIRLVRDARRPRRSFGGTPAAGGSPTLPLPPLPTLPMAGLRGFSADLTLGPAAELTWVDLSEESPTDVRMDTIRVALGREARFEGHVFLAGGRVHRQEIRVRLGEPGATCAVEGLALASRGDLVDVLTVVEHEAPHTTSKERFRGILSANGRSVFFGRVRVAPDAAGAETSQRSESLVLSPSAWANTRPQLEILTDDVRATHAATVGRLDEAQLFYLRTRGIGLAEARRMLVTAFAEEITGAVADPRIARRISARVRAATQRAED